MPSWERRGTYSPAPGGASLPPRWTARRQPRPLSRSPPRSPNPSGGWTCGATTSAAASSPPPSGPASPARSCLRGTFSLPCLTRAFSLCGPPYLYLLLAQLLGRKAVFALEDPGYPKIRQVYGKWGADCRPVPLDSQGIRPEALRASGANVLHISPAHHYPTGIITSIARRQALLRWAGKVGAIIIEDDYDSELRFTGRPIPPLQSIDTEGRVVYMNTFSQTISPAMRMGFMVLPPRLLERYRRELGFYACTVPALEQEVLARFLSGSGSPAGSGYERHLSRLRKEYRGRRAAVLEAFSALAGPEAISEQGAGLHFLLRLNTEEDDEALRQRAEGLGIRLGFLSEYAAVPRADYRHTLVVNYAGLDPDRLEEAVALLSKLLGNPSGLENRK